MTDKIVSLPPKKCLNDAAHALCPGCKEPTASTVKAGAVAWHVACYRDPQMVAAYKRAKENRHA